MLVPRLQVRRRLYCQEPSLAASADGEEDMTMTKLALAIAFLMAATMYAQAQSWGMARRTGLTHQDRPRYHREPCWSAAAKPDCQQKARATQKLRPLVSRKEPGEQAEAAHARLTATSI